MEAEKYCNLNSGDLFYLAKFVVEENYHHHNQAEESEIIAEEIEMMYEEEKKLSNSKVYLACDKDLSINGSIRVTRWNYKDILPIQKFLNINGLRTRLQGSQIWHIGRFAIKQNTDITGFLIFKTLITFAINQVCKIHNSVVLAECDVKLLRVLQLMGFDVVKLSDSIHYLGSETIPVLLPFNGLKKFLDQNAHLLAGNHIHDHYIMAYEKAI
ncbi:hypothetical protein [Chryseobacterium camelliae]|uniref:hypothetical protein n=1 Tax=Chryseobacterium camelliae TaxID=1265445 RepID=UPI0012FE3A88|nr:hypothetical protein [Chryseobacterium camelliae]MDR6514773.1 hypothetical protein [Chryseobacterium camelliae]